MINKFQSKKAESTNNISLSAFRIISIFKMLLNSPVSDMEINEALKNEGLISNFLSNDSICIYINTLKTMGADITRPSKKNNFKYILNNNPFLPELNKQEIKYLFKIRNEISNFSHWQYTIEIDRFLEYLFENLNDNSKNDFEKEKKKSLRHTEIYKQYNLIKYLEKACKIKRTLLLNYLSSENGEKVIEITPNELKYENDSFYLFGFSAKLNENICLRVDKIIEIMAVKIKKQQKDFPLIKTVYKLYGQNAQEFIPEEKDLIIEKNKDFIIIESKFNNKFRALQKLLSYTSECEIIAPEKIKKELIEKLNKMKQAYL